MKFGEIDFDNAIGKALRENKLVVFAGAGVSMGGPACLPDFKGLAKRIAPGEEIDDERFIDRFLGDILRRYNIDVHNAAARILEPGPITKANSLHSDLLRLFRSPDKVRIVTTNFDTLFEVAAGEQWGKGPRVFSTPALPSGRNFSGIVHIHGLVSEPQEMILTDADFGRAYMTEGWAVRFLMDLFAHNTVLFVGYSHDDTVMRYLSRGLPAERIASRFALTEAAKIENWNSLDINPLPFPQVGSEHDYSALSEGLKRMAEFFSRGLAAWEERIAELCRSDPDPDNDAGPEVLSILQDTGLTRIFTRYAAGPAWLKWMDAHGCLDALFSMELLQERDQILADWLFYKVAGKYPDPVLQLIIKHGTRMNPASWTAVCRGLTNEKSCLSDATLRRIVIVLLYVAQYYDKHDLLQLARRCAQQGLTDGVTNIFLAMCSFETKFNIYGEEKTPGIDLEYHGESWYMRKIWELLEPNLANTYELVLTTLVKELEDVQRLYAAWNSDMRKSDFFLFKRSAIETRNAYDHVDDVIIDTVRDTLSWVEKNMPDQTDAWINRMLSTDTTILRRIAIHTMNIRTDLPADAKVRWLLRYVNPFETLLHHEVFQLLKSCFPKANLETQETLISLVLDQRREDVDERPVGYPTERLHFEWLSWLFESCPLSERLHTELSMLRERHPTWKTSEHSDLLWFSEAGAYEPVSPYSVEELLGMEPSTSLDEWLSFKGNGYYRDPGRRGLLINIESACKSNFQWGISLASVLEAGQHWTSDLWQSILSAWSESHLTSDEWTEVFNLVAKPELYSEQALLISQMIFAFTKSPSISDVAMDTVLNLSRSLWESPADIAADQESESWFERVPHQVWNLVEFWIGRLRKFFPQEEGKDPLEDREWLKHIISTDNVASAYARCLLSLNLSLLYDLDPAWADEFIRPFFIATDKQVFQQAWDGFLASGQYTPRVAQALSPAFLHACNKLEWLCEESSKNFAVYLAHFSVHSAEQPMKELIPQFFLHARPIDRSKFLLRIGQELKEMDRTEKEALWKSWLLKCLTGIASKQYFKVANDDVVSILGWIPNLDCMYPDAVRQIIQLNIVGVLNNTHLDTLPGSDLVTSYSEETALLIVHMIMHIPYYERGSWREMANRLEPISQSTKASLDEALISASFQ